MSSFTRSRRRRLGRPLHVESLESRKVLAGNVTAQLFGSTLLLTGDAQPNQLLVASVTGGKIAVLGNLTTVNGSADPFVTSKPVASIIANLNGGDDAIGFGNTAQGFADQLDFFGIDEPPFDVAVLQGIINLVAAGATTFNLPGSLTITTAGGNDLVGIIGTVGGSVVANLGSAPTGPGNGNGLMIGGDDPAYASRVGGAVSIVGGAQSDFAVLIGTTVVGGLSAGMGNGDNELYAYNSRVASLVYTGGTGQDYVNAENLNVRHGVSVATGAGEDGVLLYEFDRDLALRSVVGGSVVIDTGADLDFVNIVAAVSGALSVVTGEGTDEVVVLNTSVGLNAVINTAGGDDFVAIVDTQVRYVLYAYLGGGNDFLTIENSSALAAYLYGGPGTNNLNIDRASRAGIRLLYSTQFRTVA